MKRHLFLRLTYSLLLFAVAPFFLLILYKKKKNKPSFGKRWKEHFGLTPVLKSSTSPLWVHTVSVGEVIAAVPFIKALQNKNPQQNILITTTTSTGAETAKKLLADVEHRYMPLDFPFSIKRFIRVISPSALIIMETELWPNTLYYCKKNNIPVTVINARLSEKSRKSYAKISFFFNMLISNVDKVLCQTNEDANRFIALQTKKEKINVTGSIKFDISISEEALLEGQKLRADIGLKRKVWIAASTHNGEDIKILAAHKKLLKTYPDALLILVPRHPERFMDVDELCTENNFNTLTRTSQSSITPSTQIYLGDTMGEMLLLIKASDVCFMGGSLIGEKVGGHNLLEPAALAKPCLIGPSYFNFKKITEELVEKKACRVCYVEEDITTHLIQIFSSSTTSKNMSELALQFVHSNKGAIQKTIKELNLS